MFIRVFRYPALALLATLTLAPGASAADDPAAVIERFSQVDAQLYRGAQPGEEGFRRLRDLGVRVVVNLREAADAASTGEQRIVESLGMRYVNLPVQDGNFFTRSRRVPETVVQSFLELMDAKEGPVFVHCRRGADRTGAVVGLYRIARHGWEAERAYLEARQIGMRSWYRGLRDQILAFAGHPLARPAAAAGGGDASKPR